MTQQWNDAIEQAYRSRHGMQGTPELKLDSLLGDWLSDTLRGAFERWACEDENCPARPQWDKDLEDVEGDLQRDLTTDIEEIVHNRIADRLDRFIAEHPEAKVAQPGRVSWS